MEIDTLDKFNDYFKTEQDCIDFLKELRWGNNIICTKCGSERCYTNNDNKHYKCRDKSCGTKFNVGINTLLHNTKISYMMWLEMIYLYTKSRGRFMSANYDKQKFGISTAIIVDLKLRTLLDGVERIGLPIDQIFVSVCKNLWLKYDKRLQYNRNKIFSKKLYLINDEDKIDFNDKKTYQNILITINKFLYYGIFRRWYFYAFATSEEILSEVFIYLSDNKEEQTEITGYILIEAIKKVLHKMWRKHYTEERPNVGKYITKNKKEWKRDTRMNLGRWYILELLRKSSDFKEFETVKDIAEEVNKKREELKIKRGRNGKLTSYEFQHF